MGVEEPLGARRQSDQHALGAGHSIIRSLGGCSYFRQPRRLQLR
jgi:hypothetical protein